MRAERPHQDAYVRLGLVIALVVVAFAVVLVTLLSAPVIVTRGQLMTYPTPLNYWYAMTRIAAAATVSAELRATPVP
jgi:glucan phosphoethanolaminetransferase (alkaline phosphatase superfamily)